ncbi:MAG: AIPR family protein [Paraclostridium sp.]|uniref:AIPR family protein n=1 Tax=Paraclostridium sp. TaxID=2023273 RepID=UPI003F3FA3E7
MKLQQFREMVIEDIKVSAESEMNDIQSEFIKYFTDCLIEAEEFDDFEESYFEMVGARKKQIQIDGYSFDKVDKSCILLISDFSYLDEMTTITNIQINKLHSKLKAFIEHAISGYICKNCEESSNGYGVAELIQSQIKDIMKFRIYIISDRVISNSIKSIKKEDINGIPVEVNVWDIGRLYNIAQSNMTRESIEIDFTQITKQGLPCILATDCKVENYKSYLTVIPGDVLANLYIEHGSRLLEGNVRSFLSIRGKVNKQIRATILNEPDMFFAYNNGIAATAIGIESESNGNGLFITKLKDLQIINGGQTTASIANAVLQDKKDVSNIMVPMKLSIVNNEKAEDMIPIISRCANSQNKVDEADFFSNHPYHIRIEELSRKIYAPAINGNQYQTIWFYERARGQHTQEQMKLSVAQRKKYLLKNPKSQVIKKVELAKYINTYNCKPHTVSKGAQTGMRDFAEQIDKEWKLGNEKFNEFYFKKIISLAILFKQTERLVSNQDWYKEIKSYRANIVTYSLAIIFNYIETNLKEYTLDYKRIWNNQEIYKELEDQLKITTKEVYNFITRDDRPTLNVTEWCKKEACWTRAKKANWTINEKFLLTLVTKNFVDEGKQQANREQRLNNELNAELEVIQLGADYWKNMLIWAKDKKILLPMEIDILGVASSFNMTGKMPTAKQCKRLMIIKEKLKLEGFNY